MTAGGVGTRSVGFCIKEALSGEVICCLEELASAGSGSFPSIRPQMPEHQEYRSFQKYKKYRKNFKYSKSTLENAIRVFKGHRTKSITG